MLSKETLIEMLTNEMTKNSDVTNEQVSSFIDKVNIQFDKKSCEKASERDALICVLNQISVNGEDGLFKPEVCLAMNKIIRATIKKELKKEIEETIKSSTRNTIETASPEELYYGIASAIKNYEMDSWIKTQDAYDKANTKIVYYVSMEFLLGRALSNNLINFGYYDIVREICDETGIDYNLIENMEADPELGNGGLGRLAACFIDSLATLKIASYGEGLRYRFGLFKQSIVNGEQVEEPGQWLSRDYPWEVRREKYAVEVNFGGYVEQNWENGKFKPVLKGATKFKAIPYDMYIVGYRNNTINTLRLWSAEPVEPIDFKMFNSGNHREAYSQQADANAICAILYPNDDSRNGKILRLKQQYFLVSATVQSAIKKFLRNKNDIKNFDEKVAFQLNDTHPALIVPELMRILLDDYDLEWDEAWEIVKKTCAYTNHTVLPEALEKWDISIMRELLPRVFDIILEINRRFVEELSSKYHFDSNRINRMMIVNEGKVRMANLSIVGSHKVNGVAELHSQILKDSLFKDFYEIDRDKFTNKTNGITQRRWLLASNPKLAKFINETIGTDWITNLYEFEKLKAYVDDDVFLENIRRIKYENKCELAEYIKEKNGIEVDPNSIFDVQIKRFHEYKRQTLNIFHIIYLYSELKEGRRINMQPVTFIFAGKAAAGYKRAKLIINLINDVANVVNNDKSIGGKIKIVFLENYCVSLGEKIFKAADVSEQISTAGLEASGTGNMKFMLNGAITIGTLDGANIEIAEEAGIENEFIFGLTKDEVNKIIKNKDLNLSYVWKDDWEIRKVLDMIGNGKFNKDPKKYIELVTAFVHGDKYLVLRDFHHYKEAQRALNENYKDEVSWSKKALINIASAGKFSSDRTIEEYCKEIWNVEEFIG